MSAEPPTLEAQVQQILDDLWREKLIPFVLRVGKITRDGDEYTIHFYDSRMPTTSLPVRTDKSFSDQARIAILARAAAVSGPFRPPPTDGKIQK